LQVSGVRCSLGLKVLKTVHQTILKKKSIIGKTVHLQAVHAFLAVAMLREI